LVKHMRQLMDGKYSMTVITSADKTTALEWSFHVLQNTMKMSAGLILSLKTQQSHEQKRT
jgi:hypothetical protein